MLNVAGQITVSDSEAYVGVANVSMEMYLDNVRFGQEAQSLASAVYSVTKFSSFPIKNG